ncbi:F-box domain-containing protein [Mycena indigotica]|uniref:F-box domain-containing protein n=1 Tax=Mycena indigotica TaxID=2126181 RepID=A0A8H6S1J4_9AGAR|nr:F-box domain-containing protein [Mycena indigotica]KAF7290157.1 F-box domain-containing protein [Mycena indigotica]
MDSTPSMETHAAQDDIAQLRQEADDIDKEIERLEAELARLEAQRKTIQGKLSCIVYPVNTLPPEVLCHIFAAAASLSPLKEVNSVLLSITGVCQRWRDVAISEPVIWTRLCYVLDNHDQDRLFYRFLERSNGLPITLALDPRDRLSLPPTFFRSCSQWKEADISFPGGFLFNFLAPGSSLILPHLEKLTVVKNWGSESQHSLFSNAPRLCDVSIAYPNLLLQLGFPLQQLRKLTLLEHKRILLHDLLALLPHLHAVEDLSIGPIARFGTDITRDKLDIQSLSILSLRGKGSSLILAHTHLPHLATLSISTFEDTDAEVLVRPGILRSLSNLATLSVYLTYPKDLSFLALLRAPRPRYARGRASDCDTGQYVLPDQTGGRRRLFPPRPSPRPRVLDADHSHSCAL